jgi:outer membrane protein
MNRSVWARTGIAAAVVLMSAMGHVGVANAAEGDTLSLKIANALRSDRLFMRAGAIFVNVKTKSGDTRDVDGPNGSVATKAELTQLAAAGDNSIRDSLVANGVPLNQASTVASALKRDGTGIPLIVRDMTRLGVNQLGTPPGIKGQAAESMGTAGFSLGYYLNDEHSWAFEAYVLAAPLSTSVTARGATTVRIDAEASPEFEYAKPFGLEGQKILSTKLLPPTVTFGHYWGGKEAKFRPYTGVAAMYAIFYDTKASESLNQYVGGSNPGDTTASIKNTFGYGPMLGFKYQFADTWHLSMNVGHVKLKTKATLTTRNSNLNASTPAIQDLGKPNFSVAATDESGNPLPLPTSLADTIVTAEKVYGPDGNIPGRQIIAQQGGVTAVTTRAVQYLRGKVGDTYSRETETSLSNTILMLSVGTSF